MPLALSRRLWVSLLCRRRSCCAGKPLLHTEQAKVWHFQLRWSFLTCSSIFVSVEKPAGQAGQSIGILVVGEVKGVELKGGLSVDWLTGRRGGWGGVDWSLVRAVMMVDGRPLPF